MLKLFPEGFEEVDGPDGVELAAYTDAAGEERLWKAFGGASGVSFDAAGFTMGATLSPFCRSGGGTKIGGGGVYRLNRWPRAKQGGGSSSFPASRWC